MQITKINKCDTNVNGNYANSLKRVNCTLLDDLSL